MEQQVSCSDQLCEKYALKHNQNTIYQQLSNQDKLFRLGTCLFYEAITTFNYDPSGILLLYKYDPSTVLEVAVPKAWTG